jgi:hypothetical protein
MFWLRVECKLPDNTENAARGIFFSAGVMEIIGSKQYSRDLFCHFAGFLAKHAGLR